MTDVMIYAYIFLYTINIFIFPPFHLIQKQITKRNSVQVQWLVSEGEFNSTYWSWWKHASSACHVTWCNLSSVCRLSINTDARVCASLKLNNFNIKFTDRRLCARQHDGRRCLVCQWLRWVMWCKWADWLIVFDTDNCLIGLISKTDTRSNVNGLILRAEVQFIL